MRACKRGDYIYYFYDTGGKPRKEIALGKNYAEAVKKWAELEIDAKPTHNEVITFRLWPIVISRKSFRPKRSARKKTTLRSYNGCSNFSTIPSPA